MPGKPRRALIVIDVQNEYVTGNLRIEYPDIQLSLANIGKAFDAASAAGIPVVVVQNSTPPEAPIFARGSQGWQLHPVVAARAHDHYLEKTLPSAFAGTDLAAWIAAREIDTLAIVGYMTQNCVAATVLHALHAGLAVEVLQDATGAVPYANRAGQASAQAIHQTYHVVFQSRFAAVLSTEEWLHAICHGSVPERDSILLSNRRAREAASLPAPTAASHPTL